VTVPVDEVGVVSAVMGPAVDLQDEPGPDQQVDPSHPVDPQPADAPGSPPLAVGTGPGSRCRSRRDRCGRPAGAPEPGSGAACAPDPPGGALGAAGSPGSPRSTPPWCTGRRRSAPRQS